MLFQVKQKYERTAQIRKSNINRKQKVICRLKEQGILYTSQNGIYSVDVIPNNIKRLIIIIEE